MSPPLPVAAWRARWAGLAPREKNLLKLALVLVLGALLWQFSLAPSLTTLRSADAQARALDAQLQQMRALQAQAASLQKQPAPGFDDALRTLELATRQTLGAAAQLAVAGPQVTVTLQGVPADALAQWLVQARQNARAVPVEARLTRAAAKGGAVVWNGVLVMGLPGR